MSNNSPIFSKTPVANDRPPVVVVGLPRSGSSFLSHVVSQVENWYVFDDLLFYRKAYGIGADKGVLNSEQLKKLIYFLGWPIRARIKFPKFHIPNMTLTDVDRMDEALYATFEGKIVTWYELQREWLTRLANHHGCQNWGYKAAQDFMHLDMLRQLYPGLKVIFIYRDPRRVMASLKYIRGRKMDGDTGQYHPLAYSIYWRSSIRTLEETKKDLGNDLLEIKFEELVSSPVVYRDKIASFLGSKVTSEIELRDPNSSFGKDKKKDISPTEAWICEYFAGDTMLGKGYDLGSGKIRIVDFPGIALTTIRFVVYQFMRVLRDRSALISIKSYIKFAMK